MIPVIYADKQFVKLSCVSRKGQSVAKRRCFCIREPAIKFQLSIVSIVDQRKWFGTASGRTCVTLNGWLATRRFLSFQLMNK